MDDLITEINQELRADRGRALWKKYGGYAIAFVVGIVLVVAGRQGLNLYQSNLRGEAANAYLAAFEQDGLDGFRALAESDSVGYPMLARFAIAARLAESGVEGAEAAYLNLANDENLPELYRQAAILLAVMNASEGSADEHLERVAPIAAQEGAWQQLALEMMIGLALQKGDLAAARTHLQTLRFSPNISADLNQRLILIEAALGE